MTDISVLENEPIINDIRAINYVIGFKNVKRRQIVGRGRGSGRGKTCGSGGKGQTARSGTSVGWFEGGQTPLYMRLPKRGFKNQFRVSYKVLSLEQISYFIESGKLPKDEIKIEHFVKSGLIKSGELIKILANEVFEEKISIEANAFSGSAKSLIESAGGVAIIA